MGTFNEYGCACRCLLKLLADKGTPMSVTKFLDRFHYPDWQPSHLNPQPGVTDLGRVCDIARQLCLGDGVQVHGYSDVQRFFLKDKLSVLVFSAVYLLDPKRSDTNYHVSLLTAISPAQFSLWCPLQDGSDVPLTLPADQWGTKLCYGLVLCPRPEDSLPPA
jgi:hypothetical protein